MVIHFFTMQMFTRGSWQQWLSNKSMTPSRGSNYGNFLKYVFTSDFNTKYINYFKWGLCIIVVSIIFCQLYNLFIVIGCIILGATFDITFYDNKIW